MAGITDTHSIDVIAQDADGAYVLIMIEDRPWGAEPAQPAQLQEKINTYADYILNGSLAQHYPEAAGGPFRIRLDCISSPTGHLAHITDHASEQLAARGIEFHIKPGR